MLIIENQSKFTVAHINIRSLIPHFNDFRSHILDKNYSIIAVSETWLDVNVTNEMITIEGYSIIRRDRCGQRGGGVAIYFNDKINSSIVSDIVTTNTFEGMFASLVIDKMKLTLGVVYRPPGLTGIHEFLNEFETTISGLMLNTDNFLCLGDFNIDVGDINNPVVKKFSELLNTYSIEQLINEPTRIQGDSCSILDLILCSNNYVYSNILVDDDLNLSDHSWVQCDILINTSTNTKPPYVKCRDFRNFNLENFNNDLNLTPFEDIYCIRNMDDKLTFLNQCIVSLFDIHAPMSILQPRKKSSAFITKEIQNDIKLKNKLKHKFFRTKTKNDGDAYKKLRNEITKKIRNQKKAYFNSNFSIKEPKHFWNRLKKLGIGIKPRNKLPDKLSDVNNLNDHFMKIFNSDLKPDDELLEYFLTNNKKNVGEFAFNMVDELKIAEVLGTIKTRAIGYDHVSMEMISFCCPRILPMLTHIINSCIETSLFPQCWKTAYIMPIAKINTPNEYSDIRPISILPVLSKVIEKILAEQIWKHLREYDLIPTAQSGFRSGHSCSTALLKIVEDVCHAADNGMLTALVLLDYSKAFDKLNHKLLLSILVHYGFRSESVSLIEDYLSNRTQMVKIDDNISSAKEVVNGVPQGSILGPLFFIIYTSLLMNCIKTCSFHLYADDTQLYHAFHPSDFETANNLINADLERIAIQSRKYCLEINPSKCKVLLLGTKQRLVNVEFNVNINLSINKISIKQVASAKCLGLVIDNNLLFTKHINDCIKRAFFKLKTIYASRDVLKKDTKKMLCDSLILSSFHHADVVYNSCLLKYDANRIQLLQNACIRFICGIKKNQRGISSALKNIGWLGMTERRLFKCLMLYHKIFNDRCPKYLYEKITCHYERHKFDTRNKNQIVPPAHVTSFYQKSFSYCIYKHYNSLPNNVKKLSFHLYRKEVKKIILN